MRNVATSEVAIITKEMKLSNLIFIYLKNKMIWDGQGSKHLEIRTILAEIL